MKATQMLHDLGQSLWLDNITRDLLDGGTLQALHRRAVGDGAHLEPDDLRPRHQEQHRLRRRDPPEGQGGQVGRGAVLRAGAGGPHPGRRPVSTDLGQDERRGRLGVAGSVAAAGPRHGEHAGRGQGSARAGGAAQPLHQDSRHQGRSARHRGGDLRRRAGQRDAAVLARALRGGGRGVPARHRAAHRRRAQARCRLGRLGVHQPLGRRGRGQGAGGAAQPARASRSPSAPTRRTATCSARRAGSAPTTPAPARNACCGPARAPRTPRPPTSSTSRRSPRRSP